MLFWRIAIRRGFNNDYLYFQYKVTKLKRNINIMVSGNSPILAPCREKFLKGKDDFHSRHIIKIFNLLEENNLIYYHKLIQISQYRICDY